MSYQNEETVREFVEETREHLAAIEPDLLAMDRQGDSVDSEVVRRVFRAIHSTKGGASFLSFKSLNDVAHRMESVLDLVRSKRLGITSEVVDVLLRSVDLLRAMVDDIDHSQDIPCQPELSALDALLAGVDLEGASGVEPNVEQVSSAAVVDLSETGVRAEGPAAAPLDDKRRSAPAQQGLAGAPKVTFREHPVLLPQGAAPTLNAVPVLEAFKISEGVLAGPLGRGMRLYEVEVGAPSDSELERLVELVSGVGSLLGTRRSADGQGVSCLCATVLDVAMLAAELEIDAVQVQLVDTTVLKERLREQVLSSGPFMGEPRKPKANGGGVEVVVQPRSVEDTLRVRVALLNQLMDSAGELVLGRNQLARVLRDIADDVPGLSSILQNVNRVTTELQEGIMRTRMQPVGSLFGRYQRVVRDLARNLGKRINLTLEGEDVELDKSIIEALVDPITHIVRNCVDHAIETPEERVAMGKPPTGQVALRAFHQSGYVNILVSDDGRGISRERVLESAIEKGVVSAVDAADLSDRDVLQLALMPGLSTARAITELSGRGVGLDVVRANVERMGGSVEIETEERVGTDVMLQLPLTLAIIASLIVRAGGRRFAVPQATIEELVWVQAEDVKQRVEDVHGSPVLRLRGRLLPLVRLTEVLEIPRSFVDPQTGIEREDRRRSIVDERLEVPGERGGREHWASDYNIVVLRVGANRYGIIVDELLESEEIVVKPLPCFFREIPCFAGSTILGDGKVTMILDPGGVSQHAKLSFGKVAREETLRKRGREGLDSAKPGAGRPVILFDNAPGERFAVPQERVLRFERITPDRLETMGGSEYVKYRGAGLRILRLENVFPVSSVPADATELFLIIPKLSSDRLVHGRSVGILAWSIVDARQVDVNLGEALFAGPGIMGTALVDDCLTTFVDPTELLAESAKLPEGSV